ncbi:hypothetical protein Tco_1072024, partial [Tanacetum coccineum]
LSRGGCGDDGDLSAAGDGGGGSGDDVDGGVVRKVGGGAAKVMEMANEGVRRRGRRWPESGERC